MKTKKNGGVNQGQDQQNVSFEEFKRQTRRIYRDLFQSDPPNVRELNATHVHVAGHSCKRGW